jgi:hypothetical protein
MNNLKNFSSKAQRAITKHYSDDELYLVLHYKPLKGIDELSGADGPYYSLDDAIDNSGDHDLIVLLSDNAGKGNAEFLINEFNNGSDPESDTILSYCEKFNLGTKRRVNNSKYFIDSTFYDHPLFC